MISHDADAVTVSGMDLNFPAYVDTAAAKSVAGREAADVLISECKERGWPFALVDEHEPFCSGPGRRVWSEQALVLAVVWARVVVILRISIINQSVPTLLSKFVFKRLGARIDLDDNSIEFKRFPGRQNPSWI